MTDQTKYGWFVLVLLLIFFCSSCAWIKDSGQLSFLERDLEGKILRNPSDYNANYMLGIAHAIRGEKVSTASTTLGKFFLKGAIPYLEQAIRIKPDLAEAHLALGEIFGNDKINDGIGGLTTLVMNLLALGILVEVIYGAGIFGMGIVGNVVALINSIGSSGFVGLLSLVVLLSLFRGRVESNS